MNSEDDDFAIDRQVRIAREEAEEAALAGRLTAPANEVRHRTRRAPSVTTNQDFLAAQLREKQMTLVDEQLKLQNILIENAEIAKEEAKERLKMATAQRKLAELNLCVRGNEVNPPK